MLEDQGVTEMPHVEKMIRLDYNLSKRKICKKPIFALMRWKIMTSNLVKKMQAEVEREMSES